MFAAQDAGKAEAVAEAAGASAVTTPREAVAGADIVVLAVPYSAVEDVAREIAPVAGGKIVIDPTNPLKADGSGLATDPGTSGAETLAALLPDARVVKAFNTLFATNTANPAAHGTQLDSLFATDDEAAKDAVCGLERLDRLPAGARRPAGRGARARGDGLAEHPDADADGRQLEHRVRDGRPARRRRSPTAAERRTDPDPAPTPGPCAVRINRRRLGRRDALGAWRMHRRSPSDRESGLTHAPHA